MFRRIAVAAALLLCCTITVSTITNSEILSLRELSRASFLHAYDSYMSHGFPFDELQPLTCKPRRHDQRTRGTLDDVLGGYMLTLVDSLDALLVLGEYSRFNIALTHLTKLNFNRDVKVSVFEVNIRMIGGLLSAHQLALRLYPLVSYDGVMLLDLAAVKELMAKLNIDVENLCSFMPQDRVGAFTTQTPQGIPCSYPPSLNIQASYRKHSNAFPHHQAPTYIPNKWPSPTPKTKYLLLHISLII